MIRFLVLFVLVLAIALATQLILEIRRPMPDQPSPSFPDSKHTHIPFGKYAGREIDSIALTDDGLLYLDWLRSAMEHNKFVRPSRMSQEDEATIYRALVVYLDDSVISADLDKLAKGR